jgi:hypothetical protein
MKFVKGIPQADKELSAFLICEDWKKLREPSSFIYSLLYSIPVMAVNGAIAYLVIKPFYDPFLRVVDNPSINIAINIYTLKYVLIFFLFIGIHELIHAIFIPNFVQSKETYWGIRIYGGFVGTTQKLSKGNFMLISIAPFMILSITLPLIYGLMGLINGFWFFIFIFNAMASSVDILSLILVLIQVPKKSKIINNGYETYYQ